MIKTEIKTRKQTARQAKGEQTGTDQVGSPEKVGPQRLVSALKVFVTGAERELIQEQAVGFNSVSNYIRHRLGLNLNETGRKKKMVVAAFSVAEWDLGPDLEETPLFPPPRYPWLRFPWRVPMKLPPLLL